MPAKTKRTHPVSIRLNAELLENINKWLEQNPGFTISRLATLALQKYVSNDQVLKAVETVNVDNKTMHTSLNKMMKQHKKTLKELK